MRTPLKIVLAAGIPLLIMSGIGTALLIQGDVYAGRSTLAVGVVIAAVSGAAFIYQVEKWGLLKQTVIHCVLMLVTVLPAFMLAGWYPMRSSIDFLIILGIFAAFGVVLWGSMFLLFTKVLPKLNR
ncbi:hypothetical protein AUR04nite_28830 [Glutamicibacter uratoxydans]|uniref:DUF3021 domain-containing protein n=1 Tax=Glutamicibacter uratoxydans TaxID=43667 RepID=A0A4Y4DYA2_GLUUR|nr:DUF3021 domain-containing protein [Glutamicibacter uratoxydans]GED07351.1 hypothetical protein AUR04nite_28830 [Glutamicibacter uratoxydans]